MHLLLGNQLVLRVHRDLHVVPHPHASATVHRPGVGVGQRELVLATFLQRLTVRFETRLALSQRRNLLCQIPTPPLLELASAMSAASISSICCRYRSSRSWLAARSRRSLAPVKFRSRLFTALIRVPSTAINSRPNSSRLGTPSRNHGTLAGTLPGSRAGNPQWS